jgi:hypothetical protein
MYYRLLNCGFRLPATSGSDNFSDVWRDPPPGADRTYVRIDGPLTFQSWIAGIKAGRTFGTTGPLLFLDVDGRQPGDEIRLTGSARRALKARIEVHSIAPLDRLELIVNGKAIESVAMKAGDVAIARAVELPDGGWIAARVVGPASRYVGDSYAFAQTSPVYVVRDGRAWTSVEDARFLLAVVDALWQRVEARSPWRTEAEKENFRAAIEQARAVYRRIAGPGSATGGRDAGPTTR